MSKTVLFQWIKFSKCSDTSILNNSVLPNDIVSMAKTVLFQTIQFSINTQFSSIWYIDRTLSSLLSRPGSDGNEGVLCIPQSSSIIGTSPSYCLVPYQGHSSGESYPSAEKQSVYSTVLVDWHIKHGRLFNAKSCLYIYIKYIYDM